MEKGKLAMDNEKLEMEEGIATEKEKKLQFQEKENETQNISDCSSIL